jgi:myosin heavy subunit
MMLFSSSSVVHVSLFSLLSSLFSFSPNLPALLFPTHTVSRDYVPAKVSRGHPSFTIKHFAADVEYNATNMLEKNKDNLQADIVSLMQSSDVDILNDVFNGEILV